MIRSSSNDNNDKETMYKGDILIRSDSAAIISSSFWEIGAMCVGNAISKYASAMVQICRKFYTFLCARILVHVGVLCAGFLVL